MLPNIKKIINDINLLKNDKEKYIYIIDLSYILPIKKKNIRNKNNIIKGCQNNVWIEIKKKNKNIYINGDSDSLIIKGFLVLILSLLYKKKIKYINNININNILNKINILKNITYTRFIGIKTIIKNIKKKINK